jgi:hypothetical protein
MSFLRIVYQLKINFLFSLVLNCFNSNNKKTLKVTFTIERLILVTWNFNRINNVQNAISYLSK